MCIVLNAVAQAFFCQQMAKCYKSELQDCIKTHITNVDRNIRLKAAVAHFYTSFYRTLNNVNFS